MSQAIPVLHDADLDARLGGLNVRAILEETFAALHKGLVVQPAQTLTLFPEDRGDFITYQGVLSHFNVFGAKLSPYIVTGARPIITAWTMLMSMETGQPLLLCDSGRLTLERTAATTALAVDKLAQQDSAVLAVIGGGPQARAHLRYVKDLRAWKEIRVYALDVVDDSAKQNTLTAIDPRVRICATPKECVNKADVIMLCTSSGTPVIDMADVAGNALVTSISTNVAQAHEIDPAELPKMDVYCDYKATTPGSAGEMVLAAQKGWSANSIKGDLADLCAGTAPKPAYDKPVFFRSIGLGIEDIAVAYAIYKKING